MLFEGTCPSCLGVATITANVSTCPLCGDIVLEEEHEPEPEAPPQVVLDLVSLKEEQSKSGSTFTAQTFEISLERHRLSQIPSQESGKRESFLAFAMEYFLGYLEVVEEIPLMEAPLSAETLELQPLSSHCYTLSVLSEQSGIPEAELLRRAIVFYLEREKE